MKLTKAMPVRTSPSKQPQIGASLIEVLVAILLLAFGMLSLGAMMSFAIQMPKLSDYRATAANLASAHVERIRANRMGFEANAYSFPLNYDASSTSLAPTNCAFPSCTPDTLATMDNSSTAQIIRSKLPAGGFMLSCNPDPCTPASNSFGNIWVIWQEPSTFASLNPQNSDNCPTEVTGTFTNPRPRCLYVRFKV
jgi:type IV pilus assembly protein PilV